MDLDQGDPRPAYQRVADELRKAIADGTYQVGDQLPTLAEITDRYTISVTTATAAIRQLSHDGLVMTQQGRGAYVLRQPTTDDNTMTVAELTDLLQNISRSVDDLNQRMDVVEQTLNDRPHPGDAPSRRRDR